MIGIAALWTLVKLQVVSIFLLAAMTKMHAQPTHAILLLDANIVLELVMTSMHALLIAVAT